MVGEKGMHACVFTRGVCAHPLGVIGARVFVGSASLTTVQKSDLFDVGPVRLSPSLRPQRRIHHGQGAEKPEGGADQGGGCVLCI